MRLVGYFQGWMAAREALNAAIGWREIAERRKDRLEELALSFARSQRELCWAFRLAVEAPEIDIRDDLDAMIASLSDQIALMEEHRA